MMDYYVWGAIFSVSFVIGYVTAYRVYRVKYLELESKYHKVKYQKIYLEKELNFYIKEVFE